VYFTRRLGLGLASGTCAIRCLPIQYVYPSMYQYRMKPICSMASDTLLGIWTLFARTTPKKTENDTGVKDLS
jgi:hypothetical protein